MNSQSGLRPVGLIHCSSVGRALHRYRRVHGFKSCSGLNFFRLKFHNCLAAMISHIFISLSAVQIYELLYIHLNRLGGVPLLHVAIWKKVFELSF